MSKSTRVPRAGQQPRQPGPTPLIVGVGASAGGLKAFKTFLEHMPADSGMGFVLIQHLPADRPSALAELLAGHTAMPVTPATDGAAVAPDHVYVIPPNATLTIAGGRLRLETPAPERPKRHPVDSFLSSLADDQGENAVGIILSGLGSDGTPGAKHIKARGGLVLAEAEADHDAMQGMPRSAASTGMVDAVLPIEAMPARLIEHCRQLAKAADEKNAEGLRRDASGQLASIMALLNKRSGHDFSHYKEKTLTRRVQRRMQVLQIDTMAAYVERLRDDPQEFKALFRELLIGVTEFFRDPPAWDALRASVIARLIANRGADDTIRIWVPGCATGEEAYSIAILLREALEREQVAPRVQIFATDLDEQAIAAARRGRYAAPVQGLSPERLERWFTLEGKYVSAVKDIREMCTFSRQNVAKDPPFSNLDLVSCRNLLIYLDTDLQDSVLRRLHYALKPGGYLFLGISESISRSGKLFDVVDEKQHIFRRGDMLPQPLRDFALPRPLQPTGQSGAGLARHTDDQIDRRVQRAIEKHALVYVVIDRHHDILRFSGGEAALYLEPSPGTASLNLFSMLRQALRPSVRAAVQQVFDSGQPVREDNLTIDADSQARTVSFSAEPVAADGGDIELCVIVFHDAGPAKGDPITGDHAAAALEKQVRGLKAQLDRALAELGVKNEEIKSVTEEYQSVNEELQAANEELETSKEEMQSVNEELQTINAEVNDKNGQLMQLNNDLRNLLASTEIATVFLDNDLIIKSFTPGIKKLFHLRDSDRGRPLTELVPRADYAGLQDDVARVLRDGIVVERAVNVPTAQMVFLMRIRPYRTQDGTVDGVVITFVDISARYRKNLAHRDLLLQELSHRVKNTLATVGSIAAQTLKTSATLEAFENRFFGRLKTLAQTHDLLTRTEWRGTSLRDLVRAEFAVYGSDKDRRWKLKGPDVQLNAKAALAVGLALHELMSNATTYGALTTPVGCIDLHWRIDGAEEDCVLHLDWVEQGGPPVEKPARPGFGLRLIEQGLAYELDANVKLDFHADGLRCTMRLPLERAVEVEPA